MYIRLDKHEAGDGRNANANAMVDSGERAAKSKGRCVRNEY